MVWYAISLFVIFALIGLFIHFRNSPPDLSDTQLKELEHSNSNPSSPNDGSS